MSRSVPRERTRRPRSSNSGSEAIRLSDHISLVRSRAKAHPAKVCRNARGHRPAGNYRRGGGLPGGAITVWEIAGSLAVLLDTGRLPILLAQAWLLRMPCHIRHTSSRREARSPAGLYLFVHARTADTRTGADSRRRDPRPPAQRGRTTSPEGCGGRRRGLEPADSSGFAGESPPRPLPCRAPGCGSRPPSSRRRGFDGAARPHPAGKQGGSGRRSGGVFGPKGVRPDFPQKQRKITSDPCWAGHC